MIQSRGTAVVESRALEMPRGVVLKSAETLVRTVADDAIRSDERADFRPTGRDGPMALRRILVALLATAGLLVAPATALAHPLGNFTTNRYSRIEITTNRIAVRYILDLAEIPTFQEMSTLDADGDGIVTDSEKQAYATTRLGDLSSHLSLTLGGILTPLSIESSQVDLLPGQGGLKTLRLAAWLVATPTDAMRAAGSSGVTLSYRDDNTPDRIGWREIVISAGEGVTLSTSSVPSTDVSKELTSYPTDMLTSPLDRRAAAATVAFGGGLESSLAPLGNVEARPANKGSGLVGTILGIASSLNQVQVSRPTDVAPGIAGTVIGEASSLTRIVGAGRLGGPAIALAFVLAVIWGAAHALSPGHGKTIVAAYLVGSRGTTRHAVFLGLTVTATHTIGIYLLGLLTLVAARYVVPEMLYPWLAVAAGVAVVAVGITTLGSRVGLLASGATPGLSPLPTGEGRPHPNPLPAGEGMRQPAFVLATTPAVSSIYPESGDLHDDHLPGNHHHSHKNSGHDHDHPHAHGETDDGHTRPHDVGFHSHGPGSRPHSHVPPGADGAPVTWRSLLALGVAGGILPCPSALVLMLGAIAIGQVAFGLALVAAFSAGLALVLTSVGIAFVHARRLITTRSVNSFGRLSWIPRLAPIGSALFISFLGLGMAIGALAQAGVFGTL